MKFLFICQLFFALPLTALYGQITSTSVAPREPDLNREAIFDSSSNFLGKNVYAYIGQELFLIKFRQLSAFFSYRDFSFNLPTTSYFDEGEFTYEDYETILAEKYFTVLDVILASDYNSDSRPYCYLQLEEKESGKILYYRYSSTEEMKFPFISVGYHTKQEGQLIGKKFVFKRRAFESYDKPVYDIITGKKVEYIAGSAWTGEKLTIDERNYRLSIVLRNDKAETIIFDLRDVNLNSEHLAFEKSVADKYIHKFGLKTWRMILDSQLQLGMTSEMCYLAWGNPSYREKSGLYEKWHYPSKQYLYFKDGKLIDTERK